MTGRGVVYTEERVGRLLQVVGCNARLARSAARVACAIAAHGTCTISGSISEPEARDASCPVCSHSVPVAFDSHNDKKSIVTRAEFEAALLRAVSSCGATLSLADFRAASRLFEGALPVAILLCGTSGTGKSTLASLLASRLSIPCLLSTDSVRHMLASLGGSDITSCSTYEAYQKLSFSEVTDRVRGPPGAGGGWLGLDATQQE